MTKPEIFYTGPIVKRAEAKDKDLSKYFTGKPCATLSKRDRQFVAGVEFVLSVTWLPIH